MPNLSIFAGLLNEGMPLNDAACLSILVTRYLADKGDSLTLSDIADATGLGTDQVGDSLKSLRGLGWVTYDETAELSEFTVERISVQLAPVQNSLPAPQDGGISDDSAAVFTHTPLDEIVAQVNGQAPKKRGPYKPRKQKVGA